MEQKLIHACLNISASTGNLHHAASWKSITRGNNVADKELFSNKSHHTDYREVNMEILLPSFVGDSALNDSLKKSKGTSTQPTAAQTSTSSWLPVARLAGSWWWSTAELQSMMGVRMRGKWNVWRHWKCVCLVWHFKGFDLHRLSSL